LTAEPAADLSTAAPSQPDPSRPTKLLWLIPGILTAAAIAGVATGFGHLAPVVGAPVFAIVIGLLASRFTSPHASLKTGVKFTGKRILQAAVVLLGTGLSAREVAHGGLHSLPVMLGTLAIALGGTVLLGRLLKVRGATQTLIGVGTGICGASAIAATTAVIGAAEVETAYAISTIFVFNATAVLIFPAIGHALGLSQHSFGLWSGTAINDTSSVVAATNIYGDEATAEGVVVKLTRTLMIIPICVGLALIRHRRQLRADSGAKPTLRGILPMFIVWFLVAAGLNSLGVFPDGWHPALTTAAQFLTTMALAAIGLSVNFGQIKRAGHRPLLLGGALWACVAVSSLLLQAATGTL
jgi:uncharacterized integral membrane protein (TIGR00698 family)